MGWLCRRMIPLMVAALLLALPVPSFAFAAYDGAWLENPALVWNEAGMPIPKAPPLNPLEDPQCLEQLRPADSDAARLVEAAGWKLYIGDLADGNVRIVRGLAGFDGMCRPMEYQAFAFTDSTPPQFVGTLSPTTMGSRTDGALIQIELVNLERIVGRYARYTDRDALCCPSAVTTVTFRMVPSGSNPVLSRVATSTEPTSAAAPASSGSPASPGAGPAPAQVPRAR
jgi:hypothetical protein